MSLLPTSHVFLKTGMNKIIFLLFFVVTSFALFAQNYVEGNEDSLIPENEAVVQEALEITPEEAPEELTITLPDYLPWENVKLEGKLKMQGLPLSPSLKILMQKDSIIDLSIRAPFVGEAGRMVITQDTVTVVNKMNKTFVKKSITEFLKYYPGGLSDIQDLLLARVFIPGYDLYETDIEELVDIFYEDDQFNIVPNDRAKIPGITYGYAVDDTFKPLWLLVMPEEREDIEIDAQYIYNLQGYDLILTYIEGDKKRDLTLELKNPDWNSEKIKPLEINKKFRQVSFSDFLRAF